MNKYIALTLLCSTIAFGFGYSMNVTVSVDNSLDSYQLSDEDYNEVMSIAAKIQELNHDVSSIDLDELPETLSGLSNSSTSKTLDKSNNEKSPDARTLFFTDTPELVIDTSSNIYSI